VGDLCSLRSVLLSAPGIFLSVGLPTISGSTSSGNGPSGIARSGLTAEKEALGMWDWDRIAGRADRTAAFKTRLDSIALAFAAIEVGERE
jgi:hypothetical protein